ncbi:MAG TPA: substrate-binding domain-containing protein [Candidatus Deferrimicrobiaceae bacterium]|nr:substrate-binding domain-containing protein [Candidatus Deferrimicrobiaceae bacterium]
MILRRHTSSVWPAAMLAALLVFGARASIAETIRISGTGGAIGTMKLLGEAFRKAHPDVEFEFVPGMGSSGAVKAVLAGRLDIGLCGRSATGEERTRGVVDIMYAKTPFVFAVNRSVKKSGITLATAVEIYAGKRTRWEDGSRIRLILRPMMDSDIPVLKNMSRQMAEAVDTAQRRDGMIVAMTDQDAADAIELTPGGFGAMTLALILSEGREIRPLALNGTVPSLRSIMDGSYPYTKTFCLLTRENPSPAVRRFIEFVRSPKGASILAKYGQVAVR